MRRDRRLGLRNLSEDGIGVRGKKGERKGKEKGKVMGKGRGQIGSVGNMHESFHIIYIKLIGNVSHV
jgi:hypothetical protein